MRAKTALAAAGLLAAMLAGCASGGVTTEAASSPAGQGSSTPSAAAVTAASPDTSTCPAGVGEKLMRGLSGYDLEPNVDTFLSSASDVQLQALVPLAKGLCVVGYTERHTSNQDAHGTVFFLPTSRTSELISALGGIGYTDYQQRGITYSLNGAAASPGVPVVTTTPADDLASYDADFTGLFSEPVLVVRTFIDDH